MTDLPQANNHPVNQASLNQLKALNAPVEHGCLYVLQLLLRALERHIEWGGALTNREREIAHRMQSQALELLSWPAAEAMAFLVEEEGDDGSRFVCLDDLQRAPEDAMDEVVQTMYFRMAAKVWDFPQPPTE